MPDEDSLPCAAAGFGEALKSANHPMDVLNLLHDQVAVRVAGLSVLGCWYPPRSREDWDEYVVGRNQFQHRSMAAEMWPEYFAGVKKNGVTATQLMAWTTFEPFTLEECRRASSPRSGGMWVFGVLDKYMRDGLYCPLGHWMLVYWSTRLLHLTMLERGSLYAAARFATMRIDQMVRRRLSGHKQFARPLLTVREVDTVRRLAQGETPAEIAKARSRDRSTVRDSMQSAAKKLETNPTIGELVTAAMRRRILS